MLFIDDDKGGGIRVLTFIDEISVFRKADRIMLYFKAYRRTSSIIERNSIFVILVRPSRTNTFSSLAW